MALSSVSSRLSGALIGIALLAACGTSPAGVTTPAPSQTGMHTQSLVPFSYWGSSYGISTFGLGGLGGFGAFGGPLTPLCGLVPYNLGAIGSALPTADAVPAGIFSLPGALAASTLPVAAVGPGGLPAVGGAEAL